MSATRNRIRVLCALALLGGTSLAVQAQDATPPPASARPSPAPDGQASPPTPQAPAAATTQAPASDTPAAGPKPAKGSSKTQAAPKDAGKPARPPLDLKAPDIRTVISPDELREPLPSQDQQADAEEDTTVQVKAQDNAPDVPGGFGALWWAMQHPSQAWRIFTPAE